MTPLGRCEMKLEEAGFIKFDSSGFWVKQSEFIQNGKTLEVNGVKIYVSFSESLAGAPSRVDFSVHASDCSDTKKSSNPQSSYSCLHLVRKSMSTGELVQRDLREIMQELFKEAYDILVPWFGRLASAAVTGDL